MLPPRSATAVEKHGDEDSVTFTGKKGATQNRAGNESDQKEIALNVGPGESSHRNTRMFAAISR